MTEPRIDRRGAWCSNCGNRDSVKKLSGAGCLLLCILFVTVIGLLLYPFLPKTWHCQVCKHQWRA